MTRGSYCIVFFCLALASCAHQTKEVKCGAEDLYKEYWTWQMETYPTWASSMGWGERHDRFFQNTEENIKKVYDKQGEFLDKVEDLISQKACRAETINLTLLKHSLDRNREGYKFQTHLILFESMGGPHTQFPQLYKRVPLETLQNYRDFLKRLSQIPKQFEQAKALSRLGLERGITPPKVTFKNYESSILDLSKGDPKESPYFLAFKKLPAVISGAVAKEIREEALDIIQNQIMPSYKDLYEFWVTEYYPNLRETIAAKDLPKGEDYYDYQIRKYTTIDKSAKEIHEIGLSEVARIRNEMEEIKKSVAFEGDLVKFFSYLREAKKFYVEDPKDLIKEASYFLKTMDGKLPKLFGRLPKLSYGLEPIPDFIAHKSPSAYYIGGDIKIGRAGVFQINLSNIKSRPLYNLEALSLHEGVPGHHLQVALAQELESVPEFRKHFRVTSFVEGWALYAESLGKLVGMYQDPYSDFGRLTYEMWRAMRLVVDTGVHALGWSREKAIAYMRNNSGISLKNITNEVDRYINWPGQALSYKIGELKIKELRALSMEKLGDKYDIREFHDVVLGSGAIPLPLLEKNIRAYISKRAKADRRITSY